jgi:hypothetical protein
VDRGCARSIEAIESGLFEEQTIVKHDDNFDTLARESLKSASSSSGGPELD